ncbi:MAG: helix-turn-helix domain-containing protein [Gammaproteobacteria bacterium]|nr:helix-turn-helix domain-containing protein [Gammaproteobacteria bacterium]
MQEEIYERARKSRDARFDGQFYIGVRTTGIYCRPICPANTPKSENVMFFPTAAAASEAGYRPCLRCRPECAPGTPAWSGTSTTVRRGLKLIASGALDDSNIEELATRLGVTSRHLRRLFTKHLGASPLAVAHTQRLHFAKQLIDQTRLPMQEIAMAAGYGSIRRFNDSFVKTYGRSPRELRRAADRSDDVDRGTALTVKLPCRMPFDWRALLAFFSARATPGIESVDGDRYLRTIKIDGQPGVIDLRQEAGGVVLTMHGISTRNIFPVVQRCREMFDLDAPMQEIANVLSRDVVLGRLLNKNPGVRVPGAWDGFELTVRAILGQQISVKAATTIAGRIANTYGEPVSDQGFSGLTHLFPEPERLARARFNNAGLTRGRAETLRRMAQAVVNGSLTFDASQDPATFRESLIAVPGIGEWTAQYVAMRAVKNPDAFPAADLGLLRAFDGPGRQRLKPGHLEEMSQGWRPWRAYAALLLWGSAPGSGG